MRRPSGQRGFTLIEALVSIALAVLVVGVVAFSVTQVQQSIEDLRNRTTLSVTAENALAMLERDLAHMTTDFTPPAPFSSMNPVPVPLAMNSTSNGPVTGDPTSATPPVPRRGDSIKIFTITPAGQRAYVEYCLSGSSDTSPGFIPSVGGGLYTAALQRHVLGIANPGDTQVTLESTPSTWIPGPSQAPPTAFYASKPMSLGPATNPTIIETPITLVSNVISFAVSYIPPGGNQFVPAAAGQPANFFLPTGQVKVVNYTATASSSSDYPVLSGVPVGYPIELAINGIDSSGNFISPTGVFTVRRWTAGSLTATPPVVQQVMLSDHVNVSPSIASNGDGPPATQTVHARAFTPPVVIGVTLTLRYGLGPNGQIMTLRREIAVSRS
jgi:type II secretory pathway pseudopilin PulG